MSEGADGKGGPFADEGLGPTVVRPGLSGRMAGEYLLGERLGEGAMGVVYKGVHPLLGREAAVKLLHVESADGTQKLLAEARLVAQVRHPNIIDIFGFGATELGQPYFVMELLAGEPLDLWLRERPPLPSAEAVGILKQLFSGLAAAHAAGVIHRDLKPGNLFMAKLADGTHFLKILDFGLSKRVEPAAPESTRGTIVGTPLYMAPEQTVGDPSTPATDLYAAGCIAYELLTGQPPFSAASVQEVLHQHREVPAPALPGGVHPLLKELVTTLLAKSPSQRPASALEVRASLERVERRLAAAAPSGQLPPQRPPRPAAAKPARPSGSHPPHAQAPEQATVVIPTLRPSGSRRALSASQERPTVRMEPRKTSSRNSPALASSRPSVVVSEEPPAPPEAEPLQPEVTASPPDPTVKTLWILGVVAVVLLALLAAILLT